MTKHETGTEEWARGIQGPFIPRWGNGTHNKAKCCASVYSPDSYSGHQCDRKAKVFYGELGYCGQHDPAAVVKRREETNARYRAIATERDRQSKERERRQNRDRAALEAIRQIAAGHNDPMTLARAVLSDAGEWPPKDTTE